LTANKELAGLKPLLNPSLDLELVWNRGRLPVSESLLNNSDGDGKLGDESAAVGERAKMRVGEDDITMAVDIGRQDGSLHWA
jgi:hypothetical protein